MACSDERTPTPFDGESVANHGRFRNDDCLGEDGDVTTRDSSGEAGRPWCRVWGDVSILVLPVLADGTAGVVSVSGVLQC